MKGRRRRGKDDVGEEKVEGEGRVMIKVEQVEDEKKNKNTSLKKIHRKKIYLRDKNYMKKIIIKEQINEDNYTKLKQNKLTQKKKLEKIKNRNQ